MVMCWVGIVGCLAYMALVGCGSCQYPPGPQPATGGATATGGVPGTGGAATGGTDATGGATGGGGSGTGGATAPSEAELICSHLDTIGCPEGRTSDCLRLVELYQSDDRFSFDAGCLLLSNTPEQARKCGSVSCGSVQ